MTVDDETSAVVGKVGNKKEFNMKQSIVWKVGLKFKVMLILLIIWGLYGAANLAIQQWVILPSYVELEHDEARKDVQRCIRTIDREIHYLDALVLDWSSWDDTYTFVSDRNKEYIKTNITETTFTNSKLNLICCCNKDGNVVYGELFDSETKTRTLFDNLDLPQFSVFKNLLRHPRTDSSIAGVVVFSKRLLLVASRPILTSDEDSPMAGTFFMGRYLDEKMVTTLKEQTRVNFEVMPVWMDQLNEEVETVLKGMEASPPYIIESKEKGKLWIYTVVFDIVGSPAFVVKAKTPMNITLKGTETLRYALWTTIVTVFIVFAVLLYLIQRAVLRPITRLTEHTLTIGTSGDLSTRINLLRDDEIGTLANEFDKMLGHLETQNTELEVLSIELVDDITRRQEAEAKLKAEIQERIQLAEQKEALLVELNKKNKILENMAVTDSLTGLYNHKYMYERLEKEIAEAKRYSKDLSIIMLDIDYFKKVNDTYGHQAGDDILVGVADKLKETLREVDIAGRYGGEEFMLILTYTELNGAIIGAKRLRKAIENMKWDIDYLIVTISAGVTGLKREDTASTMVERADALLYKAKHSGRNRVES